MQAFYQKLSFSWDSFLSFAYLDSKDFQAARELFLQYYNYSIDLQLHSQ